MGIEIGREPNALQCARTMSDKASRAAIMLSTATFFRGNQPDGDFHFPVGTGKFEGQSRKLDNHVGTVPSDSPIAKLTLHNNIGKSLYDRVAPPAHVSTRWPSQPFKPIRHIFWRRLIGSKHDSS